MSASGLSCSATIPTLAPVSWPSQCSDPSALFPALMTTGDSAAAGTSLSLADRPTPGSFVLDRAAGKDVIVPAACAASDFEWSGDCPGTAPAFWLAATLLGLLPALEFLSADLGESVSTPPCDDTRRCCILVSEFGRIIAGRCDIGVSRARGTKASPECWRTTAGRCLPSDADLGESVSDL